MTIRNTPQTLAWEPLDSEHILACQRTPVEKLLHLIPAKYITAIQQNAPNACCHDTKNLDIEAWWSNQTERNKGAPDIYKIYCNECQCCHARFCVGGDHVDAKKHSRHDRPDLYDPRPYWEIR